MKNYYDLDISQKMPKCHFHLAIYFNDINNITKYLNTSIEYNLYHSYNNMAIYHQIYNKNKLDAIKNHELFI